MANFNLQNYAEVKDRIREFYQEYRDGSIRTFLVKQDGPEVVFEARVYRSPEEATAGVYTSGWAREIEGKSPVNKTSHLENCETSSIGRALANLGYGTDANRASRSEMLKVARMEQEHADMLEYIRAAGAAAKDDEVMELGGKDVLIKEHIREHWPAIKEQFLVAQKIVTALEKATAVGFSTEAGKELAHA